jgi:hypothetical protein
MKRRLDLASKERGSKSFWATKKEVSNTLSKVLIR